VRRRAAARRSSHTVCHVARRAPSCPQASPCSHSSSLSLAASEPIIVVPLLCPNKRCAARSPVRSQHLPDRETSPSRARRGGGREGSST
jgi:hypothetical protein